MIYRVILIASCLLFLVFASCDKGLSSSNPNLGKTPQSFEEVFQEFWYGMNQNYVYWDHDTTDWDAIYKHYKPMFRQMDLKKDEDLKRSVQYFREMTKTLFDGHFYMSFNGRLSDSALFPLYERKRKKADFHNPYPYFKNLPKYLDSNSISGIDSTTDPSSIPLFALYGTLKGRALYFTCSKFSLFRSYYSSKRNEVQAVLDTFFRDLRKLPTSIKGIVIDIRGNPGGDLGDLDFFFGRFIDKPLHFGYTSYKINSGRLDYSGWIEAYINPLPGSRAVDLPIVVLADLHSASLAELITMAVHALPNGIFVGENTWGAASPYTSNEIYNSGPFKIVNFGFVQISSARFKYIDHKIYETIGFPPDFYIPYNKAALDRGTDFQLEQAISLIN